MKLKMFYDRWILTQVAGPDSESEPLGLAMAVQVMVAVAGVRVAVLVAMDSGFLVR